LSSWAKRDGCGEGASDGGRAADTQFLFSEAGPDERPVLKWADDEGVAVVAESFGAWFSATVDEELGYED
jgi:hypothetical protein